MNSKQTKQHLAKGCLRNSDDSRLHGNQTCPEVLGHPFRKTWAALLV